MQENKEAIDDFLSNELEKRMLPKQDYGQVITITMSVIRTFSFFLLSFLWLFWCHFITLLLPCVKMKTKPSQVFVVICSSYSLGLLLKETF